MKRLALALSAFLSAASPAVGAETLIGMVQISRSDGMLTFAVLGSFSTREECERRIGLFADGFVKTATESGRVPSVDFAACDDKAPPGSEFHALRHGSPTKHYVLFTPALRIMMVHKDGGLDYERQTCNFMKGQLFSQAKVGAECQAPLESWLK